MLSSISWLQFLSAFGALSLLWIAWVYKDNFFRKNAPPQNGPSPPAPAPAKRIWQVAATPADSPFPSAVPGARRIDEEDAPPFEQPYVDDEPGHEAADDPDAGEFQALEEAARDIAQVITDNKEIGSNAALLEKLAPVIGRYPALHHPTFKAALHNMIVRAAFNECGLSLTRADTDTLWP